MWSLWRSVTGEWCISDAYGTTVTIGENEEVEALIEELQNILDQPKENPE